EETCPLIGSAATGPMRDLRDPASIEQAVREAAERHGLLHNLTRNAGVDDPEEAPEGDSPDAVWNEAFAVSVTGLLEPCRVALPAASASGRAGRDRQLRPVSRFGRSELRHGLVLRRRRRSALAMTQVNIGVIGVGALALRGILPHLTQDDVRERVRVRALCDPVVERAQATAEQYEIESAYATVNELLADDSVDAVTVASPIGLHYEHCRRSLEAGKHVHVNKTMCTTVAEADELIELSRAKNLQLVASPGEGLRPQLRRTRELIEEGAIGELSWAICGGSFESYHEADEPERLNAPGVAAINPAW